MKVALLIGSMLAVLGIGAFLILNVVPQVEEEGTVPYEERVNAAYFADRIVARAIEDVGHPIEGFDAELLIAAYPALVPADFEGVQTFEGRYTAENGALAFVRDHERPMSSAEKTISATGYETLLLNLTARLRRPAETNEDVDALLAAIDTGGRIETMIGGGASAFGVSVTPEEVLEDSRCPVDVECVQAGTVRVSAMLASGLGSAPHEFTLGVPITTEAEEVTLVEVVPVPESGTTIDPSDYRFIFEIKKRDLGVIE